MTASPAPSPIPTPAHAIGMPPGAALFARFRMGLLALVVLVSGGLTAATVAEIVRDRGQAEEEALRHVQNLTKTLELHAQGIFRTAAMAAAALSDALTPRPGAMPLDDGEVRRLMERLMAGGTIFRTLGVADADGWVRVEGATPGHVLRVADRDYFRAHQGAEDRGPFISAPLLSRVTRSWVIIVSRRIADAAGNFAGVAWATIDLSRIEQFYASLDVGPQGSVSLWTPEGYLLARHPAGTDSLSSPSQLAASIREHFNGRREGTLSGPSVFDGVSRVVAFRAVEGLPLYVSVRMAEQDYLADWRATSWQHATGLAGEVLVVALLTVLLLRYLRRLEATARALQDSERRARAIFDSTFQYMALLDPDGRMLAINRAGLDFGEGRFSDGDPASAVGCPAWKMRAWRRRPDSAERMRAAVERAAAGTLVRFEAELEGIGGVHTVDCSVKPVRDEDGRVVLLVAEARDITERKRMEDSLRESEARLRSYLDAATEGIVVTDRVGRYVDANPAACAMLGYTRDELLALRVPDVMAGAASEAGALPECFSTLQSTGEFRGEAAVRRKDGTIRRVEINAVRLGADRNLGVLRDVTERVLAVERLAQAKEQAESASRIKSNFLATMSHELRTPLNAIIGFSEIMVHQVFGPIGSARYAEYARHIQQSGTHLLDLINDVLDMSKLEAGRYTLDEREIRLDEVLESCLAVSAVPAEAGGVALVPAVRLPLPRLRGDERAVRQVVLNLLSNAVKFTPPGGRVTLSAALLPEGALEIAVSDTGIGIAPEALQTVTEPFQQADTTISRRFGGTGLGLAISRNLTELHGGTLGIVSALGRGTTVSVRFPAERVVPEAALEVADSPA